MAGAGLVEHLVARDAQEEGEVRADVCQAHAWAIMGMNVLLGLRHGVWGDGGEEAARAAAAMLVDGPRPAT